MITDYSDIIDLPHQEPQNRQRMSMQARAAQFAPFAALTVHSAAIEETARRTEDEIDLCEDDRVRLDQQLSKLLSMLDERPQVTLTYFAPDARKKGGSYRSVTGIVQKVDDYSRTLTLVGGSKVEMQHIIDINIISDNDLLNKGL